jgi:hypothetical protein
MVARKTSQPVSMSPVGSLQSRRTIIKHGAIAAGALLLPWRPRWADAQSATFDYYISPTGSDSNPGTQAAPWSITAINTKQSVYAGKRVGLLDGTYNVYTLCQAGAWNLAALVVNGGTATSPTVIAAVNPRKAILDAHQPSSGAYPTSICAIIGQGSANSIPNPGNFVVDGLVLTGANSVGFQCRQPSSAAQGGIPGVILRNCEIYDLTSNSFGDNPAAVDLQNTTGFLMQNCLIHPMLSATSAQVCGLLSFNCLNNVYEYCTIYAATMAMEEKEGPQGGTTVQYCYLENNSTSWAAIKDFAGGVPGQTTTFHHNIIVGQAVCWENTDATNPSQISQESLSCYNNTFYCPGKFNAFALSWYSWGSGDSTSPPAMDRIYNNIFYSAGGGGLIRLNQGTVALLDFNLYQPNSAAGTNIFYNPPGTSGYGPSYTLPNWQSASSLDVNSKSGNPLFANASSANPVGYKLGSGSPAVGTGRLGGVLSGATCNMGAWDGTATQIGCDFASGIATSGGTSPPTAPVLSVD